MIGDAYIIRKINICHMGEYDNFNKPGQGIIDGD